VRALVAALLLPLALLVGAAGAQTGPGGFTVSSPILRLDQDRLFRQSLYGQRVLAELEAATRALAAENARIDEALSAEEQDLTAQREDLSPEEFRALADAFDTKVVGIRKAQDAKTADLNASLEQGRIKFFEQAYPVLGQLVQEAGALAILDSRAIVLSSSAIDVTDLAIQRVDTAIGDGDSQQSPQEAPQEGAEGATEGGSGD